MTAPAVLLAVLGAVVGAALGAGATWADENQDLDLIPEAARQPAAPSAEPSATADARQRIYVENAVTLSSSRPGASYPPPAPASWQERAFVDVRREWGLGEGVNLTVSDRLNLRAQDDLAFPSHGTVINDFREGYASWEPLARAYVDVGRINLKSGVASGFNPTDFFKTRAVVEPVSSDPSVQREDRLGTAMVRVQRIWDGGAVTAAFAPKLRHPTPLSANASLPSFDPSFDRTNAQDRLLLKGSFDISKDLSPELLLYHAGDRTTFGGNITKDLGKSVVAYAEWAGGRRGSLIDEALRAGRDTGTLPADAPDALPADPRRSFQNDLSAGASYTTETRITFNLEYHFHQAGFSNRDWRNWFAAGRDNAGASAVARQLWFIRAYADDQQEPISEHSLFLRADWTDAFVPNLELTGFIDTDLYDGSSLAQVTADYYLSNAWTIGVLADADLGRGRSDYGSLPQAVSVLFKVARYF
jgi:hypothetical protein